jgi:O-acetyl-ADP-ribose deacetylase (regulator of RNase III)
VATRRQCFVISPIGLPDSDVRKHADDVFQFVIAPAVEAFGITAVRSDHIINPGRISEQMFQKIMQADVCIVLLTGHNPNVFYELAVAQCAARPTILLLRDGERIPFDIQDLRVVHYDVTSISRFVGGEFAKQVEAQIRAIESSDWQASSLFEEFPFGPRLLNDAELRLVAETARPVPLSFSVDKAYVLPNDPDRRIQVVTGTVERLVERLNSVDVIVTSENTDLQLARWYDPSLSGVVRYLDADKSADGRIARDSLNESLQEEIARLGLQLPVMTGTVVATRTTGLARTGVKYVFHLAVVQGSIGAGYSVAVDRIEDCVNKVYQRFKEIEPSGKLDSILFPLIGAGTARRNPDEAAMDLLTAIVNEMTEAKRCKTAYLLAWKESHLVAFRRAAATLDLVEATLP